MGHYGRRGKGGGSASRGRERARDAGWKRGDAAKTPAFTPLSLRLSSPSLSLSVRLFFIPVCLSLSLFSLSLLFLLSLSSLCSLSLLSLSSLSFSLSLFLCLSLPSLCSLSQKLSHSFPPSQLTSPPFYLFFFVLHTLSSYHHHPCSPISPISPVFFSSIHYGNGTSTLVEEGKRKEAASLPSLHPAGDILEGQGQFLLLHVGRPWLERRLLFPLLLARFLFPWIDEACVSSRESTMSLISYERKYIL